MEIRGCIFDMDGVIVDSTKYHYQSWKKLADELQVDFSEQVYEGMKGTGRVDSLERILALGNLHVNNDMKVSLMERKNAWYQASIANIKRDEMLPGVLTLLEELKAKGVAMAVGSSSKNARLIIEKLEIAHFFGSSQMGVGNTNFST